MAGRVVRGAPGSVCGRMLRLAEGGDGAARALDALANAADGRVPDRHAAPGHAAMALAPHRAYVLLSEDGRAALAARPALLASWANWRVRTSMQATPSPQETVPT